MYYAGIGSRITPDDIGVIMTALAREMEKCAWTLRSGAATGADTFFEEGVEQTKHKEIFIHKGYVHGRRANSPQSVFDASQYPDWSEAMRIASEVHPAWHRCGEDARGLHARNIYQVLGPGMNPRSYSSMVICWAIPDIHGVPEGGTRTAWKVAELYDIPRFNLAVRADRDRIEEWLETRKTV